MRGLYVAQGAAKGVSILPGCVKEVGNAILVVLVFVGLVSVLAIQMVSSQQLEDRTTTRMKQKFLAHEMANTALLVAETAVYKLPLGIYDAPLPKRDLSAITTSVSNDEFFVWDQTTLANLRATSTPLNNPNLNIGQQRDAWWRTYGLTLNALYDKLDVPAANRPDFVTGAYAPRFIIEEIEQDIDISMSAPQRTIVYYRITVRAGSGPARSTLQAVRDSTFIN
ncbi:MAG: hypothetical protein P8176_12500 [Gammaproteobacteria bacterium]